MQPDNPAEFGRRIYEMMGLALGAKQKAASTETSSLLEDPAVSEGKSSPVSSS